LNPTLVETSVVKLHKCMFRIVIVHWVQCPHAAGSWWR